MAEPNIRLKSISINEPTQVVDVTGDQTATLKYVVERVAPVVFADLTLTAGHRANQVDHTVRSARRIVLEKIEALCEALRDQIEEHQGDCQT